MIVRERSMARLQRVLAAALLALGATLPSSAFAQAADVPYVPTPMNVVEAMLDLAKVGPNDVVVDLGSGDGRIVIVAAKKYGARGLGIELDGALVSQARREAEKQGVKDRAEFRTENLFVTDLQSATVITTYLFPRLNLQLRPRIFEQLKPGSRVVSHEFDFGSWKPDAQLTVKVPNKPYGPPQSDVYLWVVPANVAGRWQWKTPLDGAVAAWELSLEQTFQELRGTASVDGKPARVDNPRLRGDEIRFTLVGVVNGREARHEYVGRVSGEAIRGKARVPNAESGVEWQATRTTRGKINIEAAAGAPALAANY